MNDVGQNFDLLGADELFAPPPKAPDAQETRVLESAAKKNEAVADPIPWWMPYMSGQRDLWRASSCAFGLAPDART